jgi:hypothetical protein
MSTPPGGEQASDRHGRRHRLTGHQRHAQCGDGHHAGVGEPLVVAPLLTDGREHAAQHRRHPAEKGEEHHRQTDEGSPRKRFQLRQPAGAVQEERPTEPPRRDGYGDRSHGAARGGDQRDPEPASRSEPPVGEHRVVQSGEHHRRNPQPARQPDRGLVVGPVGLHAKVVIADRGRQEGHAQRTPGHHRGPAEQVARLVGDHEKAGDHERAGQGEFAYGDRVPPQVGRDEERPRHGEHRKTQDRDRPAQTRRSIFVCRIQEG